MTTKTSGQVQSEKVQAESVGTRLQEFIEFWDTPKNFAGTLHRFAQAALLMHLNETDSPHLKDIRDGYFYIGKICEILNPDAENQLIV